MTDTVGPSEEEIVTESVKTKSSKKRIAKCAAILGQPLPVEKGQDIKEACPSPGHAAREPYPVAKGVSSSERSVNYKGHVVKVKTYYEITIDDKPFERHLGVNEKGQVHCHALPYQEYKSTLNLVCDYIDGYPDHLPEPSVDHDCKEAK